MSNTHPTRPRMVPLSSERLFTQYIALSAPHTMYLLSGLKALDAQSVGHSGNVRFCENDFEFQRATPPHSVRNSVPSGLSLIPVSVVVLKRGCTENPLFKLIRLTCWSAPEEITP